MKKAIIEGKGGFVFLLIFGGFFIAYALYTEYKSYQLVTDIESMNAQIDLTNVEEENWHETIVEILEGTQQTSEARLQKLDSLLAEEHMDRRRKQLVFLKGELYYAESSYESAIDLLRENGLDTSPRGEGLIGACYVGLRDFEMAKSYLGRAKLQNPDFAWYLGNMYEVQGEITLAAQEYRQLLHLDSLVYSKCIDRLAVLQRPAPVLLEEVVLHESRYYFKVVYPKLDL